MHLDESHPLNQKLVSRKKRPGFSPIMPPDGHPDPYMQLGSHPDVVQRVWDDLGRALPVDCRAIVYGTPSLVDPRSGVVLAMAYGTAYVIRVPERMLDGAYQAGCRTERSWTSGGTTCIAEEFGRGWVFGAWAKEEIEWLREVFADLQEDV
jgi:hypothetical protein